MSVTLTTPTLYLVSQLFVCAFADTALWHCVRRMCVTSCLAGTSNKDLSAAGFETLASAVLRNPVMKQKLWELILDGMPALYAFCLCVCRRFRAFCVDYVMDEAVVLTLCVFVQTWIVLCPQPAPPRCKPWCHSSTSSYCMSLQATVRVVKSRVKPGVIGLLLLVR